jgi:hypothetical protein
MIARLTGFERKIVGYGQVERAKRAAQQVGSTPRERKVWVCSGIEKDDCVVPVVAKHAVRGGSDYEHPSEKLVRPV